MEHHGEHNLLNVIKVRKLNYFVFCLLALFFIAQPWSRGASVNLFYALTLVGIWNIRYIRSISLEFRAVAISLTCFLMVAIISWFMSPYLEIGARAINPYLLLLFTVPCYLAIKQSKLSLIQFCIALVCGAVSLFVYAFLTYQSGFSGRWEGIENAVGFGNYTAILGVLLILPVFFKSVRQSRLLVVLLALGCVVAFYTAYKSGTRSSAAVIVLVVVFTIVMFKRFLSAKLLFLLTIITLLLGFLTLANSQRFVEFEREITRYVEIGDYGGSFGQRLGMWKFSACLANMYPLTGVGVGAFKSAQQDDLLVGCDVVLRTSYYQAHSVYFHSLATMGYPGLLILFCVFASSLLFIRNKKLEEKGLIAIPILSFMIMGLTVDLFFMDLVASRFVVISALLFAVSDNNNTG